jgi:hypothetical protein
MKLCEYMDFFGSKSFANHIAIKPQALQWRWLKIWLIKGKCYGVDYLLGKISGVLAKRGRLPN